MNSLEIEAFMMIMETGSLSMAANKLFVSQSTITNRLISLENEIGEPLILRKKGLKKIELTHKGIEFVEFANRYISILKDIDLWKNNISPNIIKISMPHSINSYLLKEFIRGYSCKHNTKFSISSHWNHIIYNMLDNHQLDIGLVSRPFASKNLITKHLFSEPMVLIYDKRFSVFNENTTLNDLKLENEVFLDWGPDFDLWHNENFPSIIFPKIKVDSANLIEFFLQSNNAWSITPECVAYELKDLSQDSISIINLENLPIRKIFLVKQLNSISLSKKVMENFIEELTHFLQNSPHIIF